MAESEVEEEFEQVRKRRTGGINQLIKNFKPWHFIMIVFLIMLYIWTLKDPTMKNQAIIIGVGIVSLVFFFSKKAEISGLISDEVATRIAIKGLENRKEEYNLPSNVDIKSTNCCRLETPEEPMEWHIGIKTETREGKIDYWRVDVHAFDGIITGIVEAPTGFTGNEIFKKIVVQPKYYAEE